MKFEITKAATTAKSAVTEADMSLINAQALRELTPEEVFTFKVQACNDLVDRDCERFPLETLEKLAPMFMGKTMILDHKWSAGNQTARIYKTYVVKRNESNALMAECYMLRSESTKDLINAIQGGILREVSVGCAIGKPVCSICGEEYHTCGHLKGSIYNGKLCVCELTDPVDAYELSFVAVPAQPQAGVTKSTHARGPTISALSEAKARLEIERERWRFL